jgi:hypothetical protein
VTNAAPTTASATAIATNAAASKASRQALGLLPGPIVATSVYHKVSDHNFEGKKGESWVLFTPEGHLIRATTYDGNLGKRFSLGDHNQIPLPAPDSKDRKKALKGYSEVAPGTDLPMFIDFQPVVASELPQDEDADTTSDADTDAEENEVE